MRHDEHVRERARDLAKQVREWLATPEGQASFQKAMDRADEAIKEVREQRKVPWEKLYAPFGPAGGGNDWSVPCRRF